MLASAHTHAFRGYILLTFLLSWLVWIPLALNHYSLLPVHLDQGIASVLQLLGTLGPALAASLVTFYLGGKPAIKKLWGQIGRWQVKWTWYAAAVIVFPVLIFVVAWIYRLLFPEVELPYKNLTPSTFLVTIIFLTVSVIGEEVGWRGFALPQLQKRWSALQASLLLGTVHTIWHLPFWTALGELDLFGWTYWLLSWAWVLAITIYLTWIMNNTGNSLLLALLLHLAMNIVMVGYLPITTVVPAYILLITIAWSFTLSILALYGSKRMVRLTA